MPCQRAPFRIRMVGQSYDHPRYILRDARRLLNHFYTGRGWSRDLSEARLYADPELAIKAVKRLTLRHLRRHEAKRLFTMTIVVRVHAPEDVARADVEKYLRDALVVGVNHQKFGHGPTENSLVEVLLPPVISLEGR